MKCLPPTNWILALALPALLAGCTTYDAVEIGLQPRVQRPRPAAVVFFVDGLDPARFEELLAAGRLPNIDRHFVAGGVRVENAFVSLPAITYANSVSLVTGVFPGHHGITGNRWFDRYALVLQDYTFIKTYQQVDEDFTAPTIYEMLGDEFTATMTVPVRRGATRPVDNWMSVGIAWYFDMHAMVNQLAVTRLGLLGEIANRAGRWPRLIVTYFPTTDTVSHERGSDDPLYAEVLEDVDARIGQFLASLVRAGLYDQTYRVLVTDHGVVPTPDRCAVETFLEGLGIPVRSELFGRDEPFEERLEHFGPARAVVVSGGNRRSSLHLRAGDGWWQRPTPGQIDAFARTFAEPAALPADLRRAVAGRTFPELLLGLKPVQFVAVREGEGVVRLLSEAGTARITRRRDGDAPAYRYEVLSGRDPLGYAADPAVAAVLDGGFHPSRAWMAATARAEHPDVVPQLPEYFDSPRAGDVVLFARPGWCFGGDDRGGHGGLTRRELAVPFYVGGPDLAGGASIPVARTVDLTPTLLGLLGRPEAFRTLGPPDGVDLSAELRAAGVGDPGLDAPAAP